MAHYHGTTGNDHIHGDPESNVFDNFGFGQDSLFGGAKDDIFNLTVDTQVDHIDGGYSLDTISYSGADRAVGIDLNKGVVEADFTGSTGSFDSTLAIKVALVTNVENATGSQYDDFIYGTNTDNTGAGGANVLDGGAGDDHLYGLDGNDTLIGGQGDDYIDGGAGVDTVSYADVDRGVGVVLNLSTEWLNGETPQHALFQQYASTYVIETDTLVNVENAIGTSHFDCLVGNSAANTLDGGAGQDELFGHLGNDTLIGGLGDDELTGGAGADHLIGGAGSDWAEYFDDSNDIQDGAAAPANGTMVISLLHPETNTGFAAGDTYDSIENIFGSAYDDNITGDDNNNIIVDNLGRNTFHGGGGDDTFAGNPSAPDVFDGGYDFNGQPVIINGNPDHDTVDYSMGPFNQSFGVFVDMQNQSLNSGGAQLDRFISIENITGSVNGDHIFGDGGNNVLRGLDGDDTLMGRGGDDTLIGGNDSDKAIYTGDMRDYTFQTMHLANGEAYLQVHDNHAGRDGTDNVIEVEQLQFHDVTIDTSLIIHLATNGWQL